MYASGDGASDDCAVNGERYFVDHVFSEVKQRNSALKSPINIIEVGANHGQHTQMMMDLASTYNVSSQTAIHSFEPSGAAYRGLVDNVRTSAFQGFVRLNNTAVSDASGRRVLHCFDTHGGGINCLSDRQNAIYNSSRLQSTEELVEVITLDAYVAKQNVKPVALLRIDTEGHDMRVLQGAKSLLQTHSIDYIEFEYNSTWISERHYLSDAFELLLSHNYCVGKLKPGAVEQFLRWDYRLEWFEHCNYVAWKSTLSPYFHITVTTSYVT